MTDLHIRFEGSIYRWDDWTGWRHVAGPEVPNAVLPPIPASHIPDAAGFMAANAAEYLFPWEVETNPTPLPLAPQGAPGDPPRVY